MMKILLAVMLLMMAASAHAQEVKYIDAPTFEVEFSCTRTLTRQ